MAGDCQPRRGRIRQRAGNGEKHPAPSRSRPESRVRARSHRGQGVGGASSATSLRRCFVVGAFGRSARATGAGEDVVIRYSGQLLQSMSKHLGEAALALLIALTVGVLFAGAGLNLPVLPLVLAIVVFQLGVASWRVYHTQRVS